jgi:hypothetical protein
MKDLGYTWAQVASEEATMKELGIETDLMHLKLDLIEFLELVSCADFSFRYTKGDPKTYGIEKRHEILKYHIEKLKKFNPAPITADEEKLR